MSRTLAALSIAGSDSCAGAGLQADLKTFSALGVYGATAVTAITAQNTLRVSKVCLVPADMIAAQLDAVFSDLSIAAVKTGMLGGEDAIEAVASGLERLARDAPVVVDPVLVSTSGSRLLDKGAERALAERLFPLATLITPNLHEAAALLDLPVAQSREEIERQAQRLLAFGPSAVLIKGGHGAGAGATDIFFDGAVFRAYSAPRIATKNTHGTGCTLASAIAAFLVKGVALQGAIAEAKAYLQKAIEHADELHIGAGAGPVFHLWRLRDA
ncbi:MAG: bifunctional hydroxymethylpyrimidine kinase/phosphomethylpyrimidine kinase [Rhodomicrobium sp.]